MSIYSKQITPFGIITTLLLIVYCYFSTIFVWHDNLASFASDSANYMLMALYLSPWEEASIPIQTAWPYQSFPPFFPLVLAFTGATHNMAAAHILCLAFLIISLPLIYLFTLQIFSSKWQALLITFIFAMSPSVWMNMLGILSENLYIFISFLILIQFTKLNNENIKHSILFGFLLSTLILTRTIGLSMFAAYILAGFYLYKNKELSIKNYVTPIFITIIIYLLTKFLFHSSIPSQYIDQLDKLAFGQQFKALIDAWFSSWQFYWSDKLILPYSIILLLGVLSCLGMFIRLRDFKLDAIYVLIYLFIIIIWPHPGQALRFIYPVQAILLIHAFYFVLVLFNKYTTISPHKAITLLLLLTLTVVLPTLSYSFNRYQTGKESGYSHIKEFYRIPDIKDATANASTQIQMFEDMKIIEKTTKTEDIILYFEPTYIALLSNRKSLNITFSHKNGLYYVNKEKEADYIYLSRIHPRKTKNEINGLDIQQYMEEHTSHVWSHNSFYNNEPISVFLKIEK